MNKTLKFILYLGMVSIGVISNVFSPLIIKIYTAITMDYMKSGIAISSQLVGMLFAVAASGFLIKRYGMRFCLILGGILMILGSLGCALTIHYIILISSRLLIGLGVGIYTIGLNVICAECEQQSRGKAMNYLNFFYGVGAILGPAVASLWIRMDWNWRTAFLATACLPIAVICVVIASKHEFMQSEKTKTEPQKRRFNSLIPIACMFIFIYGGIEISVSGWLPTYWDKNIMWGSSSVAILLFWASLTLGRLVLGKLTDYVGFPRFIFGASIGCVITGAAWVKCGQPIFIMAMVILIGLFLSSIFPTVLALATTYLKSSTSSSTSIISMSSILGGAVLPMFVGYISDHAGIQSFPFLILSFSILMMLISINFLRRLPH